MFGYGYPALMEPLDHLEHLDKQLVDELAQVARETVRDELREQTRKQRRAALLYGASGAVALYAGGALAVALGLATSLPGWAAALITAGVLGVLAYVLRGAARTGHPHPSHPSASSPRVMDGGTSGGMSYPPPPTEAPRWIGGDPGGHHRA